MTAPGGFLDFFVLEASDYIDQLDAQLLQGGATGPDADALQRVGRALRGSATMAKLPALAEMAGGVERVGRAMREQALQWSPAVGGALVAAVDELKILLRNVRTWSSDDDRRARTRAEELTRFAPARTVTPHVATTTTAGHDTFLATETANIGAGLELLATRPSDRDAAANVLRRVRALRGIASVKDHPALADVLEAAEQAAHPLELGEPTLSGERVALLGAAAAVLRSISAAMRAGVPVASSSPELTAFASALNAMQERQTGGETVIPIATLFYDDGGATVVEAAQHPPTTPAERFRLEVVSQGEHLRRVVGDARGVRDDLARERTRRALRQALTSLRKAAESFGEHDVASFVASHSDAADRLDAQALDSLDEVATLLSQPGGGGSLTDRLRALESRRASTALTPIAPAPAIARPTTEPQHRDQPAAVAVAEVAATVVHAAAAGASALGDLLDAGIRNLGALDRAPLSAPVALEEQPPVPIGVLLYRGRAAIQRAREIRDELRGANGPVDPAQLGELFDLLDLALTD